MSECLESLAGNIPQFCEHFGGVDGSGAIAFFIVLAGVITVYLAYEYLMRYEDHD